MRAIIVERPAPSPAWNDSAMVCTSGSEENTARNTTAGAISA